MAATASPFRSVEKYFGAATVWPPGSAVGAVGTR
jgi:hypothetical protein